MNVMRAILMLKCNSNWCLLGEIMVFTQSGHIAAIQTGLNLNYEPIKYWVNKALKAS